ncbi:hypothetical protein DD630_27505 [Streptomyces sp. BSE7F]|nr:hypothetical protein DD630_27505 [Streptomyces sp. BSE7F]
MARPGADRLVRLSPRMGLLQLPVGVARVGAGHRERAPMCPSDRHVSHARTGPGDVPMREPPKGSGTGKTLGRRGADQPVSGHGGRQRRPRKAVTSPSGQRRGIRHGGSGASIVACVTDAR